MSVFNEGPLSLHLILFASAQGNADFCEQNTPLILGNFTENLFVWSMSIGQSKLAL